MIGSKSDEVERMAYKFSDHHLPIFVQIRKIIFICNITPKIRSSIYHRRGNISYRKPFPMSTSRWPYTFRPALFFRNVCVTICSFSGTVQAIKLKKKKKQIDIKINVILMVLVYCHDTITFSTGECYRSVCGDGSSSLELIVQRSGLQPAGRVNFKIGSR